MRVFQLNTFCGVKSTGRIACEIAKLVQQDGGECRIGYGVPGISAEFFQKFLPGFVYPGKSPAEFVPVPRG